MEKLPYYTYRQITVGKMTNLMGSPLRVAIIECISNNKSCLDKDFIEKHQISVTVLKKNLRALNKGGILTKYSVGRNKAIVYKLNHQKLEDFKIIFEELYDEIKVAPSKKVK
jgi:predicted transcriptional regulator